MSEWWFINNEQNGGGRKQKQAGWPGCQGELHSLRTTVFAPSPWLGLWMDDNSTSSLPGCVWPARFLMEHPHRPESLFVHACIMTHSAGRLHTFRQLMQPLMLRFPCVTAPFSNVNAESLFLLNLSFHEADTVTQEQHVRQSLPNEWQSKFNRSYACMHIPLSDQPGGHSHHHVLSDANFIRQWGLYHKKTGYSKWYSCNGSLKTLHRHCSALENIFYIYSIYILKQKESEYT